MISWFCRWKSGDVGAGCLLLPLFRILLILLWIPSRSRQICLSILKESTRNTKSIHPSTLTALWQGKMLVTAIHRLLIYEGWFWWRVGLFQWVLCASLLVQPKICHFSTVVFLWLDWNHPLGLGGWFGTFAVYSCLLNFPFARRFFNDALGVL